MPTGSTDTSEEIKKVFVGNLSYDIDDDGIKDAFKDVGEIVAIDWFTYKDSGKFRGCGTLEFKTGAQAKKAVELNGTDLLGRAMKVELQAPRADKGGFGRGDRGGRGDRRGRGDRGGRNGGGGGHGPSPKPEGCDTVFLGNLSFEVTEDAVKEVFGSCGTIQDIRWVEKEGVFKGIAFMQFSESEATDKAVELAGTDIMGRPVRVDFAEARSRKQF